MFKLNDVMFRVTYFSELSTPHFPRGSNSDYIYIFFFKSNFCSDIGMEEEGGGGDSVN